jgi:hypothetical protein
MFQQGCNPLWGLGKYQQGRLHPVQPLEKSRKDGARMSGHEAFSIGALVQQINHSPFKHAAQITWLSIDPVWVDSVALDRGEIGCSHSSGGGTIKGKAY